jgi:hypothetical protein
MDRSVAASDRPLASAGGGRLKLPSTDSEVLPFVGSGIRDLESEILLTLPSCPPNALFSENTPEKPPLFLHPTLIPLNVYKGLTDKKCK